VLLVLAETGELALGLADRRLAEPLNAGDGAECAGDLGLPLRLLHRLDPFRGVARDDMADLMAEHAGDLRLILGQRDEAAGDVDVAARQREGVDDGAVQQREGEADIDPTRRLHQPRGDEGEIAADLGVVVDAAIFLDNVWVFERAEALFLQRRQRLTETGRAEAGQRAAGQKAAEVTPVDVSRHNRVPICFRRATLGVFENVLLDSPDICMAGQAPSQCVASPVPRSARDGSPR
jgi:hypothetical protein